MAKFDIKTTLAIVCNRAFKDFRKILDLFASLPDMDKIAIGKLGESHAENFLIALNYQIIQKNFRSRFGEIDLIAIDLYAPSRQLVFIEVKTRTSDFFGTPEESISSRKISRIFKTSIHFFNSSTKNLPRIWRIDAIAVKLSGNLILEEIKHFKNISYGS